MNSDLFSSVLLLPSNILHFPLKRDLDNTQVFPSNRVLRTDRQQEKSVYMRLIGMQTDNVLLFKTCVRRVVVERSVVSVHQRRKIAKWRGSLWPGRGGRGWSCRDLRALGCNAHLQPLKQQPDSRSGQDERRQVEEEEEDPCEACGAPGQREAASDPPKR